MVLHVAVLGLQADDPFAVEQAEPGTIDPSRQESTPRRTDPAR